MTVYPNEPRSAAEMIARYRDVKRRLNTAAPTLQFRTERSEGG